MDDKGVAPSQIHCLKCSGVIGIALEHPVSHHDIRNIVWTDSYTYRSAYTGAAGLGPEGDFVPYAADPVGIGQRCDAFAFVGLNDFIKYMGDIIGIDGK